MKRFELRFNKVTEIEFNNILKTQRFIVNGTTDIYIDIKNVKGSVLRINSFTNFEAYAFPWFVSVGSDVLISSIYNVEFFECLWPFLYKADIVASSNTQKRMLLDLIFLNTD
jgi:hypothetical protein